jgi:ribosomal protein L11 methylase PrmA
MNELDELIKQIEAINYDLKNSNDLYDEKSRYREKQWKEAWQQGLDDEYHAQISFESLIFRD